MHQVIPEPIPTKTCLDTWVIAMRQPGEPVLGMRCRIGNGRRAGRHVPLMNGRREADRNSLFLPRRKGQCEHGGRGIKMIGCRSERDGSAAKPMIETFVLQSQNVVGKPFGLHHCVPGISHESLHDEQILERRTKPDCDLQRRRLTSEVGHRHQFVQNQSAAHAVATDGDGGASNAILYCWYLRIREVCDVL